MKILVTGGTGFIGSHTCVELLDAGFEVVIIDNLYNSQRDAVDKIEAISGKKVVFYEEDCMDDDAGTVQGDGKASLQTAGVFLQCNGLWRSAAHSDR